MLSAISRFPIPESLEQLPEDLRVRILAVQDKAGFVPNVFLMLAHRPDEFRAFCAYHDALMERESGSLPLAEKEMIVVTLSARHGCLYCVVAHSADSKDPPSPTRWRSTTARRRSASASAGFFGVSNRLASLAGTPPNDEFYLMGRVPRAPR